MNARRRPAPISLALALLLLATSCTRASDTAVPDEATQSYGAGIDLDGLERTPVPASEAQPDAAGAPRAGGGAAPTRAPGAGSQPLPRSLVADDEGPTGRNAAFYLRAEPYRKLVIELTAVAGAEPHPDAVAYLRSRLEEVVDKPGGVEVLPVKTFTSVKSEYDAADFRSLEQQHRTRYSDAGRGEVVLHYLFLNGRHRAGPVLGEAWRASSLAIFTQAINALGDPLVPAAAIQRSVLLHEAGHNLALLNIGHRTPRKRYMEDNHTHSANRDSVMYYAIERGDLITSLFTGPPPNTFDADDKADLADIKAGRLRPYGF